MNRPGLRALAIGLLITVGLLLSAQSASRPAYFMMLGCRVDRFDHLPVIRLSGRTYVTTTALDRLALTGPAPSEAQDEAPPSAQRGNEKQTEDETGTAAPPEIEVVQEDRGADATAHALVAEPPQVGKVGPPRSKRTRYRLAGHLLDLADPDVTYAAELNGQPVAQEQLAEYGGARYLAEDLLDQVGLHLAYNPLEELYQLVGLIHQVAYQSKASLMLLRGLTPLRVEQIQDSGELKTFALEGGFLVDTAAQDIVDDQYVSRVGFKSQPNLGRAFAFVHLAQRTGFKVASEPGFGYATIRFGNYLQVGQPRKSSSGEISLRVDLPVPGEPVAGKLSDPPRVFVDFPGMIFDEPTVDQRLDIGRVRRLRVGQPQAGQVRVVLELAQDVDYRLLPNDDRTVYYVQLLPPAPYSAPVKQRRSGRTIMLDAGHGGSDPGAEGATSGVWEAPLNLAVTLMVRDELEDMGYEVLLTRRSDRFVSLGERSDLANRELPYVFVSIHHNWMEDKSFSGVMTFHHPASVYGPRLAALIQEEVLKSTGAVDRQVRTANFFVLRQTVMPSALIECGFLSNTEECARLTDRQYQRKLAQGIARGIDRYITGG